MELKKILPGLLCLYLLYFSTPAYAVAENPGRITGIIYTSDQQPAASVSVVLKGTSRSALTNANGRFSINGLDAGTYTLEISLIGYETYSEQVTLQDGETIQLNITLQLSNKQLEEIIIKTNRLQTRSSVTVAKMPLLNLENPQVYNVVTKDLLKEQVVVNFDDALKNAPGVNRLWSSTGRPGDGAGFFSMRGFSVQPSMVNGIPSISNGSVDPANIERIETIKGPSGTLYGSSLISFGGLINIVTKRPYETFGGEVSYTSGSYGLNRITADINAPLNEERSALLRLNAAYHTEGSFQDAGTKKSIFLAPSFSYRVNDRLSFFVNTEFYTGEATNPLMVFLNRSRPLIARTPAELNMDFNRSYTSNDLTIKTPTANLLGQITYKISNSWTSQTSLSRSTRRSDGHYSYVMFLDGSADGALDANDTLITRYIAYQNAANTATDIQQNFTGDFTIGKFRNRIVAGLDYMNIRSTNNNSAWAAFDYVNVTNNADPRYGQITRAAVDARLATLPGITKNTTNNNTYSAYLSDVFNITPQLMAMASIRYDYFDNRPSVNHLTSAKSGAYSQSAFSPKFGLVYQPVADQVSLFVNYMNGFRNVAPVPTNEAAGYPVNLKPQQVNQIEGGVKLDLFEHRLAFTASYYDIEVSNLSRGITVNDLNVTIQDGSQKSKGVEVDLIANPVPGLNIIAGYGYNNSTIVNATPATKDRRPVSAGPQNLVNAWLSYTAQTGKLKGFGAGIGGNHTSENHITNSLPTGVFTLPAYTIINATLFYNDTWYRVAIKADNITDKEYFGGWTTVEKQMPRRISVNLAFRF